MGVGVARAQGALGVRRMSRSGLCKVQACVVRSVAMRGGVWTLKCCPFSLERKVQESLLANMGRKL